MVNLEGIATRATFGLILDAFGRVFPRRPDDVWVVVLVKLTVDRCQCIGAQLPGHA